MKKKDNKFIKVPKIFSQTQEIIKEIEKNLNMPFISYWNSYDGSVCDNDVNALYEILQKLKNQSKCAIFIKSDGGNGQASLKIVNLLRKFINELVALIPLQCASAATMIALGANKILMGPLSNLTAVDTSLKHELSPISHTNTKVSVSLDELSRVVKLWHKSDKNNSSNPYESLFQYIHPLVIGSIDRAESLSIRLCEEILSYHLKDIKNIKRISHRLNSEYPSHGYPITLREAKLIGLNADDIDPKINTLLLDLNDLYSEMGEQDRKDFDQHNYHTHSVLNIVESSGIQVIFQEDKQWHYIIEEKRWRSTNDESGWYVLKKTSKGINKSRLYIN